jgi:peptide/nickel transport system permease protein
MPRYSRVMLGYVIQRLIQAALVMLAMSALVFVGVYAIGNPIDVLISPDATQDIRAATIRHYGLDLPLWQQYLAFLGRLLQGDLGRSFVLNIPVLDLVLSRPESPLSKGIMAASVLGFSVPTFWVGLILILTFAVNLDWLPAGQRGPTVEVLGVGWSFLTLEGLQFLALPALNLSLFKLAMMIRLSRAGTREVMLSDTVKFARAAGLSEFTILRRHVLRLISIPLVTVFGLEFGSTLAFAVVTETIFSWPGVGKLIIDSITSLDRPVMVGYLVLVAFLFVTINLVVDLTYALLDPRLRRGGRV